MNSELISLITQKIDLSVTQVQTILGLFDEGCTVAFIARYRKDMTGNVDDVTLRQFEKIYSSVHNLIKKKKEIAKILNERGVLDQQLQQAINSANSLQKLEDIYAIYKEKKSSRTTLAVENGLEGLANIIQSCRYDIEQIKQKAKDFCTKDFATVDDATRGACDIIAQRYADDIKSKEIVRNALFHQGILQTKKGKNFDEKGIYTRLANQNERVKYIKSYRFLAINRASEAKELSIKIDFDESQMIESIKKYKIAKNAKNSAKLVLEAYGDGLKRILLPALKRELFATLKQKASDEAIALFGKNLKELLLTPPLINHTILGVDPGYVSGCKLAIIDPEGNFIDHSIIYPTSPKQDIKGAQKTVLSLIDKYKIDAVAIGNGTASKECAKFFSDFIDTHKLDIKYAVVSEIGASVYSASKIANEEYPTLDVTTRGAISIAARLRDPMAALVKIDPKSLGIGQYQHDVNQKDLVTELENVTSDLVNQVGVDINSASYKLLSFVSGLSPTSAKKIVAHRNKIKRFSSKTQLLEVAGIGAKTYEQCVGFMRIKEGKSILDNTAIHPDHYPIAQKLQQNYNVAQITPPQIENIAQSLDAPPLLLGDIIKELQKPGFDVRSEFDGVEFNKDIQSIEDLKEGFEVSGVVRNITDFGAFIDIGLKNDALMHISQISKQKIAHPSEALHINQQLNKIKILSIDLEKQRVGLTLH